MRRELLLLAEIENKFSRFRDDSLIGTLNRERNLTSDDADLHFLIETSRVFYRKTNGVFNILIGDSLVARGYDATYSFTQRSTPGVFGDPQTDLTRHDYGYSLQHGQIDLGGIGKGWAIDQIATLLQSYGMKEFLINGGGDIYGTTEHGAPITIYLEDPLTPGVYIGTTTIMNQGFAASSPHKRRWRTTTEDEHHIVGDQLVADGSFVLAHNALVADVLATSLLLLPAESAQNLVESEGASAALYGRIKGTIDFYGDFPFKTL